MSEYFTQYIIPRSTTATATPAAVVNAVRAMSAAGFLSPQQAVTVAQVVRGKRKPRTVVMRMGPGDERTFTLPAPTRSREREIELNDIALLPGAVKGWNEFDVTITPRGMPTRQPIALGSYLNGAWKQEPRTANLAVSVRAVPVRLSRYDSANLEERDPTTPRFDEDSDDAAAAFFAHPHLGIVQVPGAAAARFWITLDPGKFIVPDPSVPQVDACDNEFIALLEQAFGCSFVQGCDWG